MIGLHKMDKIKVEYYNDVSFGGKAPSTKVIKICSRGCGKIRQKDYYGLTISYEELFGK